MLDNLVSRTLLLTLACAVPTLAAAEEMAAGKAEPAYAVTGFVKPALREKGCVASGLRIPAGLVGFPIQVIVKFAVEADGTTSRFEVVTDGVDPRLGEAIWKAIQSCQYVPGRDPAGVPASIWMVLPINVRRG